jgi:glyceraldehyde 3-phosphate dehydrogenase
VDSQEGHVTVKVGINGFGRIGRLVLRSLRKYHPDIEVVGVNDLADVKANVHLFKWDSSYGEYHGTVEADGDAMIVDGQRIAVFQQRDPAQIPWSSVGAELIIESTGLFTKAEKAKAHLQGGARKVIISAPATDEDVTLVLGVNDDQYDPAEDVVISNASCTTNCVAPVVKVLHDTFGIEKGLMTTVHSYTNDQRILDQVHSDMRRARTAGASIIPTSTGAAKAVTLTMPALKGKIHGLAMRVPTPTVSVVDFVADLSREVTVEEVNAAFQAAAEGPMKGILQYCTEPLVSIDFKGNPHSSIFDSLETMVIGGNMVKVLSWYDNEWGYSCRLGDLTARVAASM